MPKPDFTKAFPRELDWMGRVEGGGTGPVAGTEQSGVEADALSALQQLNVTIRNCKITGDGKGGITIEPKTLEIPAGTYTEGEGKVAELLERATERDREAIMDELTQFSQEAAKPYKPSPPGFLKDPTDYKQKPFGYAEQD